MDLDRIVIIYDRIKKIVIERGFSRDIEWCKNVSINSITPELFYREYSWVVINSGMKYTIAKKIYDKFWSDNKTPNFDAVNHPHKNKALRQVYSRLNTIFVHLKNSGNPLMYLETLPHIGDVTKYHLARNIGIDCAKPDRHLVRITAFLKYNNVQVLCRAISEKTGDRIGVVDLILWKFAESFPDYLEQIDTFLRE